MYSHIFTTSEKSSSFIWLHTLLDHNLNIQGEHEAVGYAETAECGQRRTIGQIDR